MSEIKIKKITEKIRKLAELFISQEEFAKKIGVSQVSVSDWLAGDGPRKRNAFRVADSLGFSREEIIDDTKDLDQKKIESLKQTLSWDGVGKNEKRNISKNQLHVEPQETSESESETIIALLKKIIANQNEKFAVIEKQLQALTAAQNENIRPEIATRLARIQKPDTKTKKHPRAAA